MITFKICFVCLILAITSGMAARAECNNVSNSSMQVNRSDNLRDQYFDNFGKTDLDRRPTRAVRGNHHYYKDDLSLWIDEEHIRRLSGSAMDIYIIMEGQVMSYLLDKNFEKQLPILPAEVKSVNFTWKSGRRDYFYNFSLLKSSDPVAMATPIMSIKRKGKVPREPTNFVIELPCIRNRTAKVVNVIIELSITRPSGWNLSHTPLRFKLRKLCKDEVSDDTLCEGKCLNGGVCDPLSKKCQCPAGFLGDYCSTALCYPQCNNGGKCYSPGRCTCPKGFLGKNCEGGICLRRCRNGGKCIQKDTCKCRKGFYGKRCQFDHCVIPCINGGKCRGVNQCKCPPGFSGDHCQVVSSLELAAVYLRCQQNCRNGSCTIRGKCKCKRGYKGRRCRRKSGKKKNSKKSRRKQRRRRKKAKKAKSRKKRRKKIKTKQ